MINLNELYHEAYKEYPLDSVRRKAYFQELIRTSLTKEEMANDARLEEASI